MAQKISQVAGVGLVTLAGGQRPAFRIQANPRPGRLWHDARKPAHLHVNGAKGSFNGPARRHLHHQRQRPASSPAEGREPDSNT